MSPGLSRGVIELRQSVTGADLVGHLLWPVVTLVALVLLQHRDLGAGQALGAFALPGVVGMFVALGMLLDVQYLSADREDGTVLRARAVPGGITGYLVGKLVTVSGTVGLYVAVVVAGGALLIDGVDVRTVDWVTFAWVLLLGLVATQSIGLVLGALVRSPRTAGYVSLPVVGLISISGIFVPVSALAAGWQAVAQVFPVYWLGLGMRAAFLPEAAAVAEVGGSWRPLETAAVLGAWALVGVVLAPVVLRRMARKESGSSVAARRDRALQRVG
ncbi:ABC transporter permease [Cellulomonas humilata]|uniref:ABC-2 type transport system permease protein n=1 Tax=Cellulomonas humilata TaxID=144055 RepID=A0ABU0EJ45_9CELL|nr:ABC transporter permease [Cellulomonas humilata]MDQ0375297.1 ABC-2 type transport system permease protein [Cellulomonas humilata]